MSIKIALPKGRLLAETARRLQLADLGLAGYRPKTRFYRLTSERYPDLFAKIFHEKDIPIQVAVGNYDLGICGLDWVEELLAKYPSSALVKISDLGYGEGKLYMMASQAGGATTLKDAPGKMDNIRIASEYPNLAEAFALSNRLRRFSVFPLWGGAEVYPPENAEMALVSRRKGEPLNNDLVPLSEIMGFSACLVANRVSWEEKDLSEITSAIERAVLPPLAEETPAVASAGTPAPYPVGDTVRLALPDGHQQPPTRQLLDKAGIRVDDYPSASGNRRPTTSLDGVSIKVIRPQDMPLQVANGNFDLAITGRDWLREHVYQFPSSPAVELLDLKSGRVKIVAVVSKELPVNDSRDLRQLSNGGESGLRVASEYVNIADKYARDNHLGRYRVVPTWGATEAFLPEDADLLIENTETGQTLARHKLKIIDNLFESTACLIGRKDGVRSKKGEKIKAIMEMLRGAVEEGK